MRREGERKYEEGTGRREIGRKERRGRQGVAGIREGERKVRGGR